MLAEGLATRYEFGGDAVGDALVRRTTGRRLEDGRGVTLVVFEDAAGVGQAQGVKAAELLAELAKLKLASVPACLEIGRGEDGKVYMVVESHGMPTLKSIIKDRGGLSPAESLDIIHAVAAVLRQASSIGLYHQDLSSSSICCNLASGGPLSVRIDGFGLAQVLPSYSPAKKMSPYFGNAEYMAPEICSGRPGTASSDLYALGILMYEMVTGKPPFVSSGASTTIKRQVYEKPLPIHLVKPGLNQLDAYEALVNRLLAKDPTGRPASAAEVMTAIEKLKEEVFFDVTLAVEDARADYPAPMSTFVEALPQPAQMAGSPGETMAFEGLSEAVARMIEAQEAAAVQPAEAGTATTDEAAAKTEAFDASFIASVVEQAASGADIGEVLAEARAHAAQPLAEVAGETPAASPEPAPKVAAAAVAPEEKAERKQRQPKKTAQVKVENPAVQSVRKTQKKTVAAQTPTVMKKVPKGNRRGGAVVAIVVIALAVLAAIGVALWLRGGLKSDEGQPVVQSRVVAPSSAEIAASAAQARHRDALEKVRLGRMMFDRGDMVGASAATAEALRIEPGCAEAVNLQAAVNEQKQREAAQAESARQAAPAAQAPAEPAMDVPVVVAPGGRVPAAEPAPAQRQEPAATPRAERNRRRGAAPAAPAAPAEAAAEQKPAAQPAADPRAEANALRARARKAYKNGDCPTAVQLLEQVRAMGQFNDLDAGVIKKCSAPTE